ncbi:flagellar export protein FliJ [Rubeoparvulum massiliense]|uniref:flagellar export protein FliJ n=1 Tax=Rubeoparvulum massiliense TaxID=1631346 RepID=UPI00065DF0B2|nr:flagellar export protein FliJ [Rubeoparvulum massiliense]
MYHYRMQRILDVKKHYRTITEKRLQQVRAELSSHEERVDSLIHHRNDLEEEMARVSSEGTSITQLRLLQTYVETVDEALDHAKADLESCHREELIVQAKWKRNRMEEQMWEKLREKDCEEYIEAVNRDEQKMLDDLVNSRYMSR